MRGRVAFKIMVRVVFICSICLFIGLWVLCKVVVMLEYFIAGWGDGGRLERRVFMLCNISML